MAAVNEIVIVFSHLEDRLLKFHETAKALAAKNGSATLEYRTDPELLERMTNATTDWRAAQAEAHLFPDQEMHDALEAFDKARDAAIRAYTSGDPHKTRDEILGLERHQKDLYRRLQATGLQHDLSLLTSLHTRKLRGGLDAAIQATTKNLKLVEQRIRDDQS